MKSVFNKLWNIELSTVKVNRKKMLFISILILLLAILTPVVEVLFGAHPALMNVSLLSFLDDIRSSSWHNGIQAALPKVWFYLAIFTVFFRFTVIVHSFMKSKKEVGNAFFYKNFITYFPTYVIGISISLLLFSLISFLVKLGGWNINADVAVNVINILQNWADAHITSLLKIENYWLALIVTIFLTTLPGYFMHALCHKSRFFWYVSHRAHHAPQFMHPLAVPDAFYFKLPLTIFRILIAIGISKLVYTRPLVLEIAIWFTLSHIVEIFNHSIVHYDFVLKNPIVRNYSRLFGEFGVYHLMHHSAKPEDHTINLSGAPFLFWDRVFGTYRKPYDTAPPIGLSDQPEIRMNPLRLLFGGIAQLWYEWRMNKDWGTRFKIIFGSIWYKPPVSKDFLVIDAVH